ncbi:hypothetical protein ACFODZ_07250 [Marinicella sediminis]|uniref:DUF3300 domain-containing protein n=1 Tax=Marinicella sediminis TaxID=1792834 RepID=A0ABV7JCU1_9GAMM|nr:hypothetical protein [Marinicella sediminis]
MKNYIFTCILLSAFSFISRAETTVVAPVSGMAYGLDLMAVSEVFKDTPNLEVFEQTINDPDTGINNLDLDANGEVDFIRVVEEVVGDSHVIILQAALGADEFQDVATIQVEPSADQYTLQIHGHEVIYGPDYFVVPQHVHVHTWPIIAWIYRPIYRPYRSVFRYGVYPRWWRPFRPVHVDVYRTRTVRFTGRNTFVVSKKRVVKPVNRVVYQPRTSKKVSKSLNVSHTTGITGRTTQRVEVKKTTTRANGNTVTKQKGVAKTTTANGRTTVKKSKQKTKVKKNGDKSTVRKTTKTRKKKNQ